MEPASKNRQSEIYSRKWYVMSAVAMSTFLSTVDGSIVNVALPTLVEELDTVFAIAQWVILIYLLTQATLLPSIGRLGDMLGKKRIYTGGIVLFTLASVLCGLSPNVYWLIGFRLIQAVGSVMMLGLGMAIITEAFPSQERGKAIGLNGTFVSIGIVLGPTLGGLILSVTTWRWIFMVNLPIGIVGAFLAWRYVPDKRPLGRQQFDFVGAFLLCVSLLSLLLALTMGQQRGFTEPRILILFGIALIFLPIFMWVEKRHPQPMLDLRLFQNSVFSLSLLIGSMVFIAIAGTTLLLPFYLQNMRGYAPQQVGLMMAMIPIFLGVAAPLSGSASDKYGTRRIASLGLLVVVAGYWVMSSFDTLTTLLLFALGTVPIGTGVGIFQSPNNSAVMGAVPPQRLGVASGLLGLSRTLGQTTGIALFGALWAGRVASSLGETPAGGATTAPISAQISGLQDTFMVMMVLMALALVLSVWGIRQELHH
ncbi:MAG: MFS transporter [Chloroflexi bacterium]|nr:MAG: MFS transporter [Chloroflexota bacterium]